MNREGQQKSMASIMHLLLNPPLHDHIPLVPPYFHILRLAQIVIALLVLSLAAYAVSGVAYGGGGYAIFVSLATLILLTYSLATTFKFPRFYNRIAVLVLECLAVVWWLAVWTSLAAWASLYNVAAHYYGDYAAGGAVGSGDVSCGSRNSVDYCVAKRSTGTGHLKSLRNALAVAAAFGAVEL
jgi:hypothetical protein